MQLFHYIYLQELTPGLDNDFIGLWAAYTVKPHMSSDN